jgi:hypothetical protein
MLSRRDFLTTGWTETRALAWVNPCAVVLTERYLGWRQEMLAETRWPTPKAYHVIPASAIVRAELRYKGLLSRLSIRLYLDVIDIRPEFVDVVQGRYGRLGSWPHALRHHYRIVAAALAA